MIFGVARKCADNDPVFMSAMAPARGVAYRYGRASRTVGPDPRYAHEVRRNADCVAYSCGIYQYVFQNGIDCRWSITEVIYKLLFSQLRVTPLDTAQTQLQQGLLPTGLAAPSGCLGGTPSG